MQFWPVKRSAFTVQSGHCFVRNRQPSEELIYRRLIQAIMPAGQDSTPSYTRKSLPSFPRPPECTAQTVKTTCPFLRVVRILTLMAEQSEGGQREALKKSGPAVRVENRPRIRSATTRFRDPGSYAADDPGKM
jgi:hypothetical protein